MHRTGTKSLCTYLRSLSLKDIHWPWWCERQISTHLKDPEKIVDILEPLLYTYDCFADFPFPGLYRVLDRRFPNSRFILVRRDPDNWVRSVRKHWGWTGARIDSTPSKRSCIADMSPSDLSVLTVADAPSLISKHARHSEEVQAYFDGRADRLLVVDLEDARINERISEFLGLKVRPYPHE